MMTQGYASGGIECIEGLPEDARFVGAFYRDSLSPSAGMPDPVFVFESDAWQKDLAFEAYSIKAPDGEVMPVMNVVFRTVEQCT
jgi:hypothetical protein